MSLISLPDELILHIWTFIYTNKDMNIMVSTCKSLKQLDEQCIKSIELTTSSDCKKLYSKYSFLDRLTMIGLKYPMSCIQIEWPRVMKFDNCWVSQLKSLFSEKTEILSISMYKNKNVNSMIQVDWGKIPNLKVLYVNAPDIDLRGLEVCKNLEIIYIELYRPTGTYYNTFYEYLYNKLENTITDNIIRDHSCYSFNNQLLSWGVSNCKEYEIKRIITPFTCDLRQLNYYDSY